MFKSSKLFYLYKVLFNYALLFASVLLLIQYQANSIPAFVLSAFLLAVFWQQSGWLAHDFLHHQVFENRTWNNAVGYLLGNVGQGFSVDWWKNKHNRYSFPVVMLSHHASPNIHGLDPDVDTLPFLAWSEHAIENFATEHPGWIAKFLVYNQPNIYFILLTFARLSWCRSSLVWALNHKTNQTLEVSSLVLHWALYFTLIGTQLTFLQGIHSNNSIVKDSHTSP
jgi:acyl-lipid Delta6-acetylenase / acyl-lipid (9-3)-desaturase